jgi:hypothetical protein
MSATEPRYCPVSTLLPAFAALPSIRRRHGGRPGYSLVSEAAGDHRRDESCAQVDGAAHVISDDRRDVRLLTGVKWVIRRRQPSAVGRVVVADTVVCSQAPPAEICHRRTGQAGSAPTMPERAVTKAAPRRMPASVAPAATEITPAKARKVPAMPLPPTQIQNCRPATWRRSGRDERNPSWPYQHNHGGHSMPVLDHRAFRNCRGKFGCRELHI